MPQHQKQRVLSLWWFICQWLCPQEFYSCAHAAHVTSQDALDLLMPSLREFALCQKLVLTEVLWAQCERARTPSPCSRPPLHTSSAPARAAAVTPPFKDVEEQPESLGIKPPVALPLPPLLREGVGDMLRSHKIIRHTVWFHLCPPPGRRSEVCGEARGAWRNGVAEHAGRGSPSS